MPRDLTITIRAKEVTQQAFESAKGRIADLSDSFQSATRSMRARIGDVGAVFRAVFGQMRESARKFSKGLREDFSKIGKELNKQREFSLGPFQFTIDLAKKAVSTIARLFSGLTGTISRILSTGFRTLRAVWDGLVSIAKGAFDAIVGVAKTAVGLIGKVWEGLTGIVGTVFNKITAIVAGGTAFAGFKLAELGASFEDLEFRGTHLASAIGQDFREIRNAVVRGTQGTISEMDAMTQANNALLLKVAETPAEFEALARAAKGLAQTVGSDTRQAFESLVTGIGRQSRLMLDNVGIIVKAEEAYRQFAGKGLNLELQGREKTLVLLTAAQRFLREEMELAVFVTEEEEQKKQRLNDQLLTAAKRTGDFTKILGQERIELALAEEATKKFSKALSELSDDDKKEAFRLVAIEQARIKLEQAGGAANTASTGIQRLKASIKNVATDIGRLLLPLVQQIAFDLDPVIGKVREWAAANSEVLSEKAKVAYEFIKELVKDIGVGFQSLIVFAREKLPEAMDFLAASGNKALEVLFLGVGLVQREFSLLRTAVSDFFQGKDFDATGSAIAAAFDVVAKQAELTGLQVGEAIVKFAGPRIIQLGDFVSESVIEPILLAVGSAARASAELGKKFGVIANAPGAIADLLVGPRFKEGEEGPFGERQERRSFTDTPNADRIERLSQTINGLRADLERRRLTDEFGERRSAALIGSLGDAQGPAEQRRDVAVDQFSAVVDEVRGPAAQNRDSFEAGASQLVEELRAYFRETLEQARQNVQTQAETADETARATEAQDALNGEIVRTQEELAAGQREAIRSREDLLRRVQEIAASVPGGPSEITFSGYLAR